MTVISYHTIFSHPNIELQGSLIRISWGSGTPSVDYDYIKPSLAQEAWEELIQTISKQKGNTVIDMRLFELFDHARYVLRMQGERLELVERHSGKLILRPDYLPQESGLMARARFLKALGKEQLLKR